MSKHKKSLLRIVGDIGLLNSVLEQCVEMEDFQFETPAEANGFKVIKEENPYIKKAEALEKAADMLSLNLESGEEKFKELAIVEQAKTLIQILKMFKCNAETSDLKFIGGSSRSGTVYINKKIVIACC